jgi:hypothetical protein
MFEYKVKEAMSRAGVNQCWKQRADEGVRGERNCERVGSGKSGCVEFNLVCRTNGVNTALSLCGGRRTADYFVESAVGVTSDCSSVCFAVHPLALAVEEVAQGHSQAM